MNALVYHSKIFHGTLEVFETRGKALCMRQMPWIFGTARIANATGGIDETRNFVEKSRHIAVFCRGAIYKVTVLNADMSLAATTQV
jgi:hypothetical protein